MSGVHFKECADCRATKPIEDFIRLVGGSTLVDRTKGESLDDLKVNIEVSPYCAECRNESVNLAP